MQFIVVDDSSTMRRIITNTLKKIGFTNIVEAADGKDALSKMTPEIDVVITDWNMPNMDGLDFVKALRAGDYKTIPILMVTTNAAKDDVIQALKAGVNNYVVKPMTPETLQEKINAVIS